MFRSGLALRLDLFPNVFLLSIVACLFVLFVVHVSYLEHKLLRLGRIRLVVQVEIQKCCLESVVNL